MFRRSIGLLAGISLVATLLCTPQAVADEPMNPTVGALRLQEDFNALSEPGRYGYVILNSWEHELIPQLKAADPHVRVLVYKDMAAAVDYATTNGVDNDFLTAGVGYQFADTAHPEWFLTDDGGERIEWCDYPGAWQMDVGDPLYQETWLSNVEAELTTYGWDGVMVDDAMADPWAHLCGRTITEYPRPKLYSLATERFLANVGPDLIEQGFLVFPNINDADVTTWKQWMGHVSGGVREWWAKTGHSSDSEFFGDHHWEFLMDQMRVTQEAGKAFIAITYSTSDDVRAMRYARASFLMGWTGGRSALIFHTGKGLDPWATEWTADVGAPLESRRFESGVWRRDFTAGTVLVNPSSSESVTVTLEPGFVTPDGGEVTRVRLRPTSGLILKRTNDATAPASARESDASAHETPRRRILWPWLRPLLS